MAQRAAASQTAFLVRSLTRDRTNSHEPYPMIYQLGEQTPQLLGANYVAANATIIGNVTLGIGANVWWNAVIRGDNDAIIIGDNVNIQDGSVLHTDVGFPLVLEQGVSVGHMVMLHGCTVKAGSLIGIKAVVLNRAVIGRDCLVGANTLVAEGKVIPDRSLVLGSPGRVVRQLTDEEVLRVRSISQHYVDNAARYLTQLKPLRHLAD
jgi:carbonic anhydrase/acetyltransferase-like protein (isoleucine patch superfamily)